MFNRFKKDNYSIPPVEEPVAHNKLTKSSNSFNSAPSKYHSSANSYNASRDGDPYASHRSGSGYNDRYGDRGNDDPYAAPRSAGGGGYNSPSGGAGGGSDFRDRYAKNRGPGDVYSRGEANYDQDRNELLGGFKPQPGAGVGAGGRFYDGPPDNQLRDPAPGEENEDDVEGIKKQTRWVKQESASSTRNALRLAREAEETARNTLGRLGDQSEKLANTERHLDVSKGHTNRAADRTDELKQLNRSIFRPVIHFNKDAKRAAADARNQARFDEERSERERAMMDVRDTQNRIGRAQTYGRGDDEEELVGSRRGRTDDQQAARLAARKKYQFEGTASDDELEDEIDDNLDEIGDVAKRLKALAMATSDELDAQNKRIDVISSKTDRVGNKLDDVTRRQKKW